MTLLHPPYTLWHLSYVAIGASLAPELETNRLLWGLAAFLLGLGVGAHALDELHGRPLQTQPEERHRDARDGFEVVFLRREPDGYRFAGHASAVEERVAWAVRYAISVDLSWATRSAHVVAESELGTREAQLETDGVGAWRVDGRPAPELAGCSDVDLEASAFTNAFPIHRLALQVGQRADAPAAYS